MYNHNIIIWLESRDRCVFRFVHFLKRQCHKICLFLFFAQKIFFKENCFLQSFCFVFSKIYYRYITMDPDPNWAKIVFGSTTLAFSIVFHTFGQNTKSSLKTKSSWNGFFLFIWSQIKKVQQSCEAVPLINLF